MSDRCVAFIRNRNFTAWRGSCSFRAKKKKRWKIFKAAKMKKEFNFTILTYGCPKCDIKVEINFV